MPASLASDLDSLRTRYETAEALSADPLSVPLRYGEAMDRELAAFVAASLAYGRVAPMLRAIESALAPLGAHPAAWLREHPENEARRILSKSLSTWVWRFHTWSDIVEWCLAWKRLDQESCHQGLRQHLEPGYPQSPETLLSTLVQRLRRDLPGSCGLRFSLPDPEKGSACKRWRLFLRWMVRSDWPDLGQWVGYPKDLLVIPLDTHVARIARLLGLSRRKTPDGRMAKEITEALRAVCPEDPLRYDFALSHLGIMGDCPGLPGSPACTSCPLSGRCAQVR